MKLETIKNIKYLKKKQKITFKFNWNYYCFKSNQIKFGFKYYSKKERDFIIYKLVIKNFTIITSTKEERDINKLLCFLFINQKMNKLHEIKEMGREREERAHFFHL